MARVYTPGKFEGEPTYAEYFYNLYLDGQSEDFYDGEELVSAFHVTNEERKEFEDLVGVDVVLLWECSQGFVYTRELTSRQYENLIREIEARPSDEDLSEMEEYEGLQ